uniref:Meckelin n=1 Tax=Spongospora subterranea TaxID=70186 RepID=A0A0H5QQ30_9EUKA|eukprot:CRZ04195.1 hypothetical protein [Spongospora subterranea]
MNLVGGVALSGSESTLQYMIVSYHLNGSLASIQPLTGELQLCPEHPARVGLFRQFGSQYENRCALSLQPLLTAPDTLFYDVFYVDNGKLFPVPVKNLNYREGGRLVNVDSSGVELTSPSARVVLHQRFVMYDNLSGRQGKTTSPPTILSYAVQTGLRVTMQSGSSSLIYPPLLVIRHSEREAVSLNDDLGSWSTVLFRAEYTKDLTSVWTAAEILFTLSLLTIGAVWLLHLWRMSLNYDVDHVNRKFLVEALSYLVLVASDILYWLVFIMCTYFLLFFKCQSTAFILLPLEDSQEEYVFTTVVIFVFFGKCFSICRVLWQQISVDLFFMDWEKPKLVSGNETGASSSVSVWRKLFVANEWNELATARNVNVDLLLIVLLFLLRGINLEYLATSQPSLSLTPGSASINILLRFAVSSGLIMLLSLAQLVYRQLVHHRLFAHQAAEFIDFMTMSNISAFVLDSNFHGYYIHGRTLHAFADSSMEEMTRQLHMERKEMVKERGLIGGKDTFEMFVTPDFRLHYISIFLEMAHLRRGLKPFSLAATTERGATKDQQGFRPGDDVALAKASAKLNRFLCSFIDRNSSTYSWAESERTFTQRVLDIPPAIRQSNMTLFYDDPNYKFTSLFLVGIEYQIVTFLAALYAVCDITFSNTFVSIMVVYAANQTLSYVRHHWGQINISKKTLVDERFLI